MPLRLIDPKATKTIAVSGVDVTFRQLTGGEKGLLGLVVSRETDRRQIEDIAGIVGNAITAVDGFTAPFNKLLTQLESASDFWQIVSEVQRFSTVEESDRKNSSSSSDGSEQSPKTPDSDEGAEKDAQSATASIALTN